MTIAWGGQASTQSIRPHGKLEDWERAKRNPQVQERLNKLQVLLLDEVSMMSSDFLDRASRLAPRCSSAIISCAEIQCHIDLVLGWPVQILDDQLISTEYVDIFCRFLSFFQ